MISRLKVAPNFMAKVGETALIVNLKNISQPRQRHVEDPFNRSRPAGEQHDLIGKRDRFGQIVGDKENRFLVLAPDFQELGGRCLRFLYG